MTLLEKGGPCNIHVCRRPDLAQLDENGTLSKRETGSNTPSTNQRVEFV
jgi:hypothetical protein